MQWYNEQVKRRENSVQINEIDMHIIMWCSVKQTSQSCKISLQNKTKQKTLAERFYNNDDY